MSKKNKASKRNANVVTSNVESCSKDAGVKLEDYFSPEEIKNADEAREVIKEAQRKREEADEYYKKRVAEAEKLVQSKEEMISKEAEKLYNKKRSELSDAEKALNEREEQINQLKYELDDRGSELAIKELKMHDEIYAQINRDKNDKIVQLADENKQIIKLKNELEYTKNELKKIQEEYDKTATNRAELDACRRDLKSEKEVNAVLDSENNNLQQKLVKLQSQLVLWGENPESLIEENARLKSSVNTLRDKLSLYPSEEELCELRKRNEAMELTENKYQELKVQKDAIERECNNLKHDIRSKENLEAECKYLTAQCEELEVWRARGLNEYNNSTNKVFPTLSEIDTHTYEVPESKHISLKELCDKFRFYLANQEKLYYDEKTIRTFIAGFAASRLMILEGLSGTGKSSLPRAFAKFVRNAETKEIPVQSAWKDRNDLLGFYNDFKKQYKETEFLKALYCAICDPERIHIIVLDEMNISRVEYYFADFLSVLEKPQTDDWKIDLISDYAGISVNSWPKRIHNGQLQICDNIWFIGTANEDDSTFTITDKVYDRAVVLHFEKKCVQFSATKEMPISLNSKDFSNLLYSATKGSKGIEKQLQEIMEKLDNFIIDSFKITFGNRIDTQLKKFTPVYIECGGELIEAIDIVFSSKILRKLEGVYDSNTKKKLGELQEYIIEHYPEMEISYNHIKDLIDKF